jgi:hypothetical protein
MKPKSIILHGSAAILLTGSVLGGTTDLTSTTDAGAISQPADDWLEASLTVGYETLHVYRGADSSFGNANVFQTLDLEMADLFHFTLYNGNSFNGEYGELTPSFYFHKDLGFLTASVGMIWYHFPGEDGVDSEEYYLQLSKDLGAGFSASAWFSYNARSEGWYHELKVNHSLELSDRINLESYVALGVSEDYRSGGNGLDNLTIGVGLPISVTEKITIRPSLGYAFALEAMDTDDEGWAGVTASYRF